MLAYRVNDTGWALWSGGRVPTPNGGKGLTPSPNAEMVLSDQELATLGLYRVTVEDVPEGKITTGYTLVDVEGLPVYRPTLEDAPPPPPRQVRKLLILDRLAGAGLFEAAMQALGGPGALAYERWQAASYIEDTDAEVRGLLTAIGADPDAILAPELTAIPHQPTGGRTASRRGDGSSRRS